MKKIAVIVGGWYFPVHLYERVRSMKRPKKSKIDLFVVSHRKPTPKIATSLLSKRTGRLAKYDEILYEKIISIQELEQLHFTYFEKDNVIGDYYFFNQWAENCNYKDYTHIIFMHDDNFLLESFSNILVDIFDKGIYLYGYENGWKKQVKSTEVDWHYIANSAVGDRKTARGSFSIWTKHVLETMGGSFSMKGVAVRRTGETSEPRNFGSLDWNTVGTNFQQHIERKSLLPYSYRISPYYRVSPYIIECERGLVSSNHVGLNFINGIDKFELWK